MLGGCPPSEVLNRYPQTLKRARLVTIFLFSLNGIALIAGAAGGLFFGPFAATEMRKFGSGQITSPLEIPVQSHPCHQSRDPMLAQCSP